MPIYEYHCATCRKDFELIESIRKHSSRKRPHCPRCEGTDTERRITRVAVETGSKGYHPARPLDV